MMVVVKHVATVGSSAGNLRDLGRHIARSLLVERTLQHPLPTRPFFTCKILVLHIF